MSPGPTGSAFTLSSMTDRIPGRPDPSDEVRAIPQGRRAGAPPPRHRGTAQTPPRGPVGTTRAIEQRSRRHWLDEDHDDPGATTLSGPAPSSQARTEALPSTRHTPDWSAEEDHRHTPRSYGEPAPRPVTPPPGAPTPPRPSGPLTSPKPPRGPRHRVRTALLVTLALLLSWAGATAWAVNSAWSQVGRVATTPAAGHIGDTSGRNTLMVGSDQRSGLTKEQKKKLGTGSAEGARTDTIMVLHTGDGDPTLLSIPRDSYVEIPGHGMNKINAAFALGGAALLSETIEKATGLRIDGYVEIGFGGFADVVDAVGGVRMCLAQPMKDAMAHVDLPAGCQTLDGKNALGYVRMRYSDPEGDLGRVKRQRQFLGALMGKVATPSTVLLPWRLHSVGSSAATAIAVGEDDSMRGTAEAMLGLRAVSGGTGHSVTVPVSNPGLETPAGTAVEWDAARSAALFDALRTGNPLPADVLPAS